jgi:sterol desaturase/sphingolipid hydroxylase (fatty acid hydroxylase superfamily)
LNSNPSTRFATYLLIAIGVVCSVLLLQDQQLLLARYLGLDGELLIFGKRLSINKSVETLISLVIPVLGALLAERMLNDGQPGAISRWTRRQNHSARIDIVFFVLNLLPLIMPLLITIFSFGLVPVLNRLVRNLLPAKLSLFDYLNVHFGLLFTIVTFFLVKSLIDYWGHRAFHSKLLWPIHRFHHSANELSLLTAFRMHPTGLFLVPLLNTLPMLLWGAPDEFLLCFFAYYVYHEVLVHSNSEIEWGWFGRYVLFAPISHKIHHSMAAEHIDKNFSTNLACWDRLFGTYYEDSTVATVGVPNPAGATYDTRGVIYLVFFELKEFGESLASFARSFARSKDA